jgi:AcrR family transcriptional regulator
VPRQTAAEDLFVSGHCCKATVVATHRSTAPQRRADAVSIAMRVIADHGATTASVQKVADEMGISQPYVFRLFGSRRGLFLACLDELESRIREGMRESANRASGEPLPAIQAGYRTLIADGVITGLWLQACAAARSDEIIAARCRAVIATVLDEADALSSAGPEAVTASLARATLVLTMQAVGMDISAGIESALRTLRTAEASVNGARW